MGDHVQFSKDHDIAVITINNPPVNALSTAVRDGIVEAIERVNKDESIRAAVLIGSSRMFAAGADIKELVKMASGEVQRGAGMSPMLLRIEDCQKPIVAAIHGTAFGGGLELAMACHYRAAMVDAQIGQPEVKLGLIPGAGGTQRLPRLAGVAVAAEMCAEGKPISAKQALNFGIIDRLIESDLLTVALAFAREVAGKPAPRTRERDEKLGTPERNAPVIAAARDMARKKQRGLKAPLAAIECIESATNLTFDKACGVEQKLFAECLHSDQSKALIHVFLGEREVVKIPDIPRELPLIPIHRAAVVGAGTMGGGIAMVLANEGIPVLLKDTDREALDRGLGTIRKNYASSVKRGRFTQQFADECLNRIQPTLSFDGFSEVDLAIEAVFEDMNLKKEIFGELDRACKPGAILASNTSSLNIDEVASSTARAEFVIGMHFFSPANVMRLIEIVRGRATSKEVIATCMQLSKKMGKIGVLVGNCPGFVGNRMFGHYRREAQFLVEEGAEIEGVDKALYDFGMAMGPLATADLAGLDVRWRIRKEHRHLEKAGIRQPLIEDNLCELGRYGQKSGAGWYKYDAERRATPDPLVARWIGKWAANAGIPQRKIPANEIVDRCVYSLINEGARILEEGFAPRAVDIDIIYLNGYGFPAHRGGPMWYADMLGLKNIYKRICEFQERHGEVWEPAPLLRRFAEQNRTFATFKRETDSFS
jgi:3-hydroxyacyl-CoA dehydrogenase